MSSLDKLTVLVFHVTGTVATPSFIVLVEKDQCIAPPPPLVALFLTNLVLPERVTPFVSYKCIPPPSFVLMHSDNVVDIISVVPCPTANSFMLRSDTHPPFDAVFFSKMLSVILIDSQESQDKPPPCEFNARLD